MIATPRRPVIKRYGLLMVKLTKEGIAIKAYRKRKWRAVTWAELARFICTKNPPPAPGWTVDEWDNVLRTMGAK